MAWPDSCIVAAMAGVRSHEELDFTATGPASRDFTFRDQIRSAASSATDRLSEGFYRYYSREFARFCSMTRGSLGEVMNQLQHAQRQNYMSKAEFDEMWLLACRAMGKTTNLLKYLLRCPPRGGWRDAELEPPGA